MEKQKYLHFDFINITCGLQHQYILHNKKKKIKANTYPGTQNLKNVSKGHMNNARTSFLPDKASKRNVQNQIKGWDF